AGRKAGAEAARARILGIETHAAAGHEKMIGEMKADGTTTPDQAAARILTAERAKGSAALARIAADDPKHVKAGQPAPDKSAAADARPAILAAAAQTLAEQETKRLGRHYRVADAL